MLTQKSDFFFFYVESANEKVLEVRELKTWSNLIGDTEIGHQSSLTIAFQKDILIVDLDSSIDWHLKGSSSTLRAVSKGKGVQEGCLIHP